MKKQKKKKEWWWWWKVETKQRVLNGPRIPLHTHTHSLESCKHSTTTTYLPVDDDGNSDSDNGGNNNNNGDNNINKTNNIGERTRPTRRRRR